MTELAVLGVLALALSGCDLVGADEPVAGSWTLTSTAYQEVATVNQAQTVLDSGGESRSTVSVMGDAAGRLEVVDTALPNDGGLDVSLLSYDPSRPMPDRGLSLFFQDRPLFRSVRLQSLGNGSTAYVSGDDASDAVARSGWTFTFQNLVLVNGERRVTVSGDLEFATTVLEDATAPPPDVVTVYSSDADGSFVTRQAWGFETVERSGTWTLEGDRLVLRREADSGPSIVETAYEVAFEDGATAWTNVTPGVRRLRRVVPRARREGLRVRPWHAPDHLAPDDPAVRAAALDGRPRQRAGGGLRRRFVNLCAVT